MKDGSSVIDVRTLVQGDGGCAHEAATGSTTVAAGAVRLEVDVAAVLPGHPSS